MKFGIRKGNLLLGFFLLLANAQPAGAGVPEVTNLFITDVTTVSFSVIWASSEASTADMEVFTDIDGTTSPDGVVIMPHPVNSGDELIRSAAEDNGVMKVMVTGLEADTTYYFRTLTTSKETPDTTRFPETGLKSVTTEIQTTRTYESGEDILPFSNDIIIELCYLEDGTTAAEGTLLVATVAGGHYPVTAFVGDGVELPNALIDLNNVFGRDSNENLDLDEGKNLTLVNFRGLGGGSIITHSVPEDLNLSEIKPGDFGMFSGRNMVSFQLYPNDPAVEEVLAPVMDDVISAWAYHADSGERIKFVKDGLPFLNDLTEVHAYQGLYLYMNNENSCALNGSFGFDTDTVEMKAGRNLVGYRSIESLPVLDAFESIYDQFISVWTFDQIQNVWISYVKDGLPFLNTLNLIEPGKAYWVYVDSDCSW